MNDETKKNKTPLPPPLIILNSKLVKVNVKVKVTWVKGTGTK